MDRKADSKGISDEDTRMQSKDGTSIFEDASYAQTYVVLKDQTASRGAEAKKSEGQEVLFACGNWCYRGQIQFNNLKMNLSELPILIPTLQRQQASLRYFCNSASVPQNCPFYEPMKFMSESAHFYAKEMTSVEVEDELEKMSKMFPWLDDNTNTSQQYFELELTEVPESMESVAIIANKTYVHGLIIISVYYKGMLYYMVKDGEGDQALLDVRFPDVTKKGQGMHLASYTVNDAPYKKLTLWNMLGGADEISVKVKDIPKVNTLSMSTGNYQQTYCILKSAWEGASPALNIHHDALFRFGSWCYAGRVQLTPSVALADVPFVIPALRMQQSRLEYLCNVDKVPTTSPFADALAYLHSHMGIIEEIVGESASALEGLVERLSRMGLGDSVSKWLDGDSSSSFFEFKLEPDDALKNAFDTVELVASKAYHASGIVTISIFFDYTLYVCLSDASDENPLLDSKFPDVSGKGRGYQITAYDNGHPQWKALRKVSIWQTVSALEQEFRDRASDVAENKGKQNDKSAAELGLLEASQGSSSFPSHSDGKSWRDEEDPRSAANIGGDSKGPSMGSESADYDGDNESQRARIGSRSSTFDLQDMEQKRLRDFEADASARNLQDFKSIGGRINSFNAAANNNVNGDPENTPAVAESKLDESMDTNIDIIEGRALSAGALAARGPDHAGSKDGPLTPVRGAAGAGGDELTPVSGTVSEVRKVNANREGSPSGSIEGARDPAGSLADMDNLAGSIESEIRVLKDAQKDRLDRDKDLLAKQEEEAAASGHSYKDRTPVGGLSGVGDSLKSINIGKMGEGSLGSSSGGGGGGGGGGASIPIQFGKGSMGASRPHHLPKMAAPIQAGLQGRLESIKRNMGEVDSGAAAPWDTRGRPLGGIGSPAGAESKK